jgi:hypothetical protein
MARHHVLILVVLLPATAMAHPDAVRTSACLTPAAAARLSSPCFAPTRAHGQRLRLLVRVPCGQLLGSHRVRGDIRDAGTDPGIAVMGGWDPRARGRVLDAVTGVYGGGAL